MVKIRSVAYAIAHLPLKFAFILYISAMKYFDTEKINCKMDKWQWQDIWMIFKHKEICLNRTRGGSKTRDAALLAVFFALRNNSVMWFSPISAQLLRAQLYWGGNPFVMPFNSLSNHVRFIRLINGNYFEIAVTTSGNIKGPRANILFLDEMALMTKDVVGDMEPITNGMSHLGDGIYMIYFSTPLINTVFEDYCALHPTLIHDWTEPSWFDYDHMMKIKARMSPSKWKTEYCCIFAAMDGQVFEVNLTTEPYYGELRNMVYYGSDPNPREGYCLVGVQYSTDLQHIVVRFCRNFGGNIAGKNSLFAYLIPESHKTHIVRVELEDNGVGKPTWDDYVEAGGEGTRVDWGTSGAGDKVMRVNDMNKFIIHIPKDDKRFTGVDARDIKKLWSQANAVKWTTDGSKIDKDPKMAWHLSDSLIHACSRGFERQMSVVAQPY